MRQSYRVLKPLVHENRTLAKGDQIELHPRQAAFLVAGGMIEPVKQDKAKGGSK